MPKDIRYLSKRRKNQLINNEYNIHKNLNSLQVVEQLGRGKRPHFKNTRYDSSEEEECEEDEPVEKKSRTKRGAKIVSEKYSSLNAIASAMPMCPGNFGFNNITLPNISQKSFGSRYNETSLQQDTNYASCNEIISQKNCSNLHKTSLHQGVGSVLSFKQKGRENVDTENLSSKQEERKNVENSSVVFDGYIPYIEDAQENWDMKENIQQILRNQSTLNLNFKDINQRLLNMENILKKHTSNPMNINNDVLIANFLPLTTVERIKEFDSLLKTTEEAVIQFRDFLLRTGGNNPKDNIQRILKKMFTNECAMNCSMKGVRNNFRVGDLQIIRIIRNELVRRHANLTETEFDGVVAEWLRFAKQRKERDDKRKQKENELNEEHEHDENV